MRRLVRGFFLVLVSLVVLPLFAPPRPLRHFVVRDFPSAPHDWPQFDGDAQHSGSSNDEPITPDNVAMLRPLFVAKLPAVSDGAPAYWTAESRRR